MMTTDITALIQALKRERRDPLCLYIYDLNTLRNHVAQVMARLPAQCQWFYALKANAEQPILQTLAPLVHGFEVASFGEVRKIRAVDRTVPVLFGGPGKTDAEIEQAIGMGVTQLHVESYHELRRVEAIGQRLGLAVPILLRVNLRGPLPAATLHMAGAPTQFGIDEIEVPAAIAYAQQSTWLNLRGFHFHSISNQLDAGAHVQLVALYIRRAQTWARAFGLQLQVINAGGGIGVNYADLQNQFDWERFTDQLAATVQRLLPPGCTLIFECGRYTAASCGFYASEVLDIKCNHGKHYLVIRGGTHHFRLPASWQHSHPFSVVPIDEWASSIPRPELRHAHVTIAGQLCTPKDILARDSFVDRIRVGDVILFQYAGAYGWAISHHDFLSHPHPEHLYIDNGVVAELPGMPAGERQRGGTTAS